MLDVEFWKTATVQDVIDTIAKGADLYARRDDGATSLHVVSGLNDNPAMAELLLDRGADLHARSDFGGTPLHWASSFNLNPVVVELLLDRGANASARDDAGRTPFDTVQDFGNLENSKVYRRLHNLQYQ